MQFWDMKQMIAIRPGEKRISYVQYVIRLVAYRTVSSGRVPSVFSHFAVFFFGRDLAWVTSR